MGQRAATARIIKAQSLFLRVSSVVAPLLLVALAITHSIAPKWFALDWESVTLLILGVVTLFLPMRELAKMIKKLEVGSFKLELREEGAELSEAVAVAEMQLDRGIIPVHPELPPVASPPPQAPLSEPLAHGETKTEEQSIEGDVRFETHTWKHQHAINPFFEIRSRIHLLMGANPQAALLMLAIELEKVLFGLANRYESRTIPVKLNVRRAIDVLLRQKVIDPNLGEGLDKFWRLRNKIVHVRLSEPIETTEALKATENGLRLLWLLMRTDQRLGAPDAKLES